MSETSGPAPGAERPVELPPSAPSTLALWALLLAGPVLWITHFAVVYLGAEASCTAVETEDMWFLSSDGLAVGVVVATVAAVAAVGGTTAWAWRVAGRSQGDRRDLARAGVLLGLGSIAAVLAVGVPALVLEPC